MFWGLTRIVPVFTDSNQILWSCSFDKNELCNVVLELLTILGIYNINAFIRTFETLDTSYVCIILLYTFFTSSILKCFSK